MLRRMALVAGGALLVLGGRAPGTASSVQTRLPVVPSVEEAAGTVEGVVRLETAPPESPAVTSPYARRRYRPPANTDRSRISPENVVIYVPADGTPAASSTTSGAASDAPPATVITQRDRTIIPHVTAIRVGTRIDFPNEDDVFHNLFSLSDPRPFNLGRYPPGESRSVTFDRPGVVRMFCDIHSEMTAVIRILETPWFARPDPDGRFRIRGVPEGPRTIVAWHDQLGADTVEVEVSSGMDARVDFHLPR